MDKNQFFHYMLLIHFLADFALQTHEQATLKSTSNKFLIYHVGTYSLVWLLALLPFFGFWAAILFSSITFVAHFCTDYVTSRVGKPFWAKQDLHNGFVVVGADQILHALQLWYSFDLIVYLFK
jgi:hypothetical protein